MISGVTPRFFRNSAIISIRNTCGVGAVGTKPRRKCSFTFRGIADKYFNQKSASEKRDHVLTDEAGSQPRSDWASRNSGRTPQLLRIETRVDSFYEYSALRNNFTLCLNLHFRNAGYVSASCFNAIISPRTNHKSSSPGIADIVARRKN